MVCYFLSANCLQMFVYCFKLVCQCNNIVLYLFQSPKVTAFVPTVGRCSSTRRCAISTTCRRTGRSSSTSRSPKDSTKTRRLKIRILKLQKVNKAKKLVSKGLIKCFKTEIVKPDESNQFSQT